MAKKRGLAARKRTKKNNNVVTKAKVNPPPLQDVLEFVVPGFVGYAGTRLTSRVVHDMVLNRWPRLAKHAKVLSTLAVAGGAWLAVHRIKSIEQHHTPVVVGAGIAVITTAVQTYLPKYGWMVSDTQNAITAPVNRSTGLLAQTSAALPPPIETLSPAQIDEELEELDLGTLSSNLNGAMSNDDIDDLLLDDDLLN